MTEAEKKKISKLMSYILRQHPEEFQIELTSQGWCQTEDLLKAIQSKKISISFEDMAEVVETNDKKRLAFNDDKTQIRASQGHSISIDLGYEPVTPPDVLYHGTATRFLDSIQEKGLKKGNRHHVHLSKDMETATKVGVRHGKLALLTVDAKAMHAKGFQFFCSENGVWLTDAVPVAFINELQSEENQ